MIIPAILAAVVLIIFLIAWLTWHAAFYSTPGKHPGPDDPLRGRQYEKVTHHLRRISGIMQKYPFEPVEITSFDGLRLFGRYYQNRDNAPLIILFHGYRSCGFRDCSGGHALARKMGFNALVIDQRAHGESDGTVITMGIKERQDCLLWARYAAKRFGPQTPIVLSGLSMGAATVLMASDLELPSNVAAIIADSPYSAPIAILEKVCHDRGYPVALCRPFLYLGALVFGHFLISSCNAKDAVRATDIPILLLHGEADHLVPCEMTNEIKAAGKSRIEAVTFPDAGHGLAYISDPPRYEAAIVDFLNSIPALSGMITLEPAPQQKEIDS